MGKFKVNDRVVVTSGGWCKEIGTVKNVLNEECTVKLDGYRCPINIDKSALRSATFIDEVYGP